MSNGELTDATGAVVNFKNTTLIMTGNFGMNQREKKMGFDSSINLNSEKARLVSYLSGTYGEEFTNRVDDIVVFNPLDDVSKKAIIRKEIDKIKNRLKDNPNIKSINIDDCVFEHLLKILHSEHGKNANLIKRILMKNFEPLLAEGIYVTVQLKKPCNITITCENGVLSALTTEAK
jgi:ATP-dependent Clp protease ATP-binding subunit ClpA